MYMEREARSGERAKSAAQSHNIGRGLFKQVKVAT